MSRTGLLARSWSAVAEGYEREMATRFEPWISEAIAELEKGVLPDGPILSLACGPGPELVQLAHAFPSRRIVGVDVAEGMAARARSAVEAAGLAHRVEARVGDATMEPSGDSAAPAAVLCCFALNQMPGPKAALRRWVERVRPGGRVVVVYWPGAVEETGPWRRLTDLTLGVAPQERAMAGVLDGARAVPRVRLLRDELSRHEMVWPGGAEQFWEVLTRSGAWHARRLAKGDGDMEAVRREFVRAYPEPAKRLVHRPAARVLVLERSEGVGVARL